jgi:hypothetical protein
VCADRIHAALRALPSIFERLVCLASFHNPSARDSFCRQMQLANYDCEQVDEVLSREHHLIFEDWLSLSLEQKMADLEECAAAQGRSVQDLAQERFELHALECLIPQGVQAPEVELFGSDAVLLLRLIAAKIPFRRS